MPHCLISSQHDTGMKERPDAKTSQVPEKGDAVRVRNRTAMHDAGMPMPATLASMYNQGLNHEMHMHNCIFHFHFDTFLSQ